MIVEVAILAQYVWVLLKQRRGLQVYVEWPHCWPLLETIHPNAITVIVKCSSTTPSHLIQLTPLDRSSLSSSPSLFQCLFVSNVVTLSIALLLLPPCSRFMSYHYTILSLQTVFQSCFSKIFLPQKKAGRSGQLSKLNQFFTNKLTIYMFTCPAALKLFCPITCNKKQETPTL